MLKIIFLLLFTVHSSFASMSRQVFYFKFDEFKIKIDDLSLAGYTDEDMILLEGYADPIGASSFNKKLSHARASSIKKILVTEYGVDESRIKIIAMGEDVSSKKNNAQQRRVEVTIGSSEKISSLLASKGYPVEERFLASENLRKNESNFNLLESKENFKKSEGYVDRYYLGAGVYNNILLVTDRGSGQEAEWVSGENYNLEAQYQFNYKNFWLGVRGEYHIQTYEVDLNPNYSWNEKTPNLFKASLVSDYETNRWGFGLDFDYHQTSFIYEEAFDIELRDIFIFGASLRSQYKWLSTKKWSSRLGLKLDIPFSGSSEISPKGELGYIGFVDLKRSRVFKNHDLSIKLYYGFRNYKNDQNDQSEESAGLLFSISSLKWL